MTCSHHAHVVCTAGDCMHTRLTAARNVVYVRPTESYQSSVTISSFHVPPAGYTEVFGPIRVLRKPQPVRRSAAEVPSAQIATPRQHRVTAILPRHPRRIGRAICAARRRRYCSSEPAIQVCAQPLHVFPYLDNPSLLCGACGPDGTHDTSMEYRDYPDSCGVQTSATGDGGRET